MNHIVFSDQESRLLSMGGSFIAIKEGSVHVEDLLSAVSGRVVRCRENPHDCIRVVQTDDSPVGCVAGWISEDA